MPAKAGPRGKKSSPVSQFQYVFQLRVELLGIEPAIWRRVEIPGDYTFWDLHVAIQNAMGWQDSHLHRFQFIGSKLSLGIPDDDDELDIKPGWKHPVRDHLFHHQPLALYEYDFGDSWLHEVRFEDMRLQETDVTYPRCTAGSRKCPPEDCGGSHGYQELLRVLGSPRDPEHRSTLEWVGGGFDPEDFDPTGVRFEDPAVRWREVFADEG